MFCPFLSCGKSTVVECSPDCALYSGTADGKEKRCSLFSSGVELHGTVCKLTDIEHDLDGTMGFLEKISLSISDLTQRVSDLAQSAQADSAPLP